MKKIWIVCCLLALLLAGSAMAESSGTCGDQTVWTLSDDGTLTVSGQGEIASPDWGWLSTRKLVIKEGVTAIGDRVFEGCSELAEVQLPGSLTKIGGYAFSGCGALASLTLPDHITEFGGNPFPGDDCVIYSNTGSDTAFHLGKDLSHTFRVPGCPLVLRYEYDLDWDMDPGKPSAYPLRVLRVDGDYAEVDIPDGVDEINWGAFRNCSPAPPPNPWRGASACSMTTAKSG